VLWLLLLAITGIVVIVVAGARHVGQAVAEPGAQPDGVVALPDGGWLLTSGWSFKLSIRGVGRDLAQEVKRVLDRTREERPEVIYASLARLIFEHGVRVDQVEDYFRENGPKYREELRRLMAGSAEPAEDAYLDPGGAWVAERDAASYVSGADLIKGLEVLTLEDDALCPCCQRHGRKKRLAAGDPRPPFHLGCRCMVLPVL